MYFEVFPHPRFRHKSFQKPAKKVPNTSERAQQHVPQFNRRWLVQGQAPSCQIPTRQRLSTSLLGAGLCLNSILLVCVAGSQIRSEGLPYNRDAQFQCALRVRQPGIALDPEFLVRPGHVLTTERVAKHSRRATEHARRNIEDARGYCTELTIRSSGVCAPLPSSPKPRLIGG
jgi:hypothetical protein